jgi:hypothetical protein
MAVDVDLCVAGDLRDPINQLPIRKALTILSTSETVIQALTGLDAQANIHINQLKVKPDFKGNP